ncbi:MAG TPA: FadR/GntR family transcriptional regulator [Pseudonocardiaceae bacterium]|nr:FadR/GntR family transcriptional regulator [Pseudonocardiaceae bacterium]
MSLTTPEGHPATSPLTATRRTGLVDQVIEQMRGAISRGDWPLDQRIPPEPELVNALGVGRNTVREAVRALSHAGLLDVRQGDGTFVRATSEICGALRRLYGTRLREVLQVRRVLEVEGARMAAIERTETELAELTEILADRDRAIGREDLETVLEADTRFHRKVVTCSHNELLIELYQGLTETFRASVASTLDGEGPGHKIEHSGLLEAIADHDPDRAGQEAGGFFQELIDHYGQPEN